MSERCTAHRESHHFDPVSGWCLNGCGTRDDGLAVTTAGNIRRTAQPEHSPEPLDIPTTLDFGVPA